MTGVFGFGLWVGDWFGVRWLVFHGGCFIYVATSFGALGWGLALCGFVVLLKALWGFAWVSFAGV